MTSGTPLLFKQKPPELRANVQEGLAKKGVVVAEGGAGFALVHIFERLAELIVGRLNQVPDKYFLAFLNEAGVDLLSPRAASTEVTFDLADDGPAFILVPAETQVATLGTEARPEIIFETQEDILITPNSLARLIAFDPVKYKDYTRQAKGYPGGFPAFKGQQERERILYLSDQDLFNFSDDASRAAATIRLDFDFDAVGDPDKDGWKLKWFYFDGSDWKQLTNLEDKSNNFSKNGTVLINQLPEDMSATLIDPQETDEDSATWIACQLTGGDARQNLPVLSSIQGSRIVEITNPQTTANDKALTAIQANTAFVPLLLDDEFYPFGPVPARMDTFYLMSDEAFSKPGAEITLTLSELSGVPEDVSSKDLDNLQINWEYHSEEGWLLFGSSTRSSEEGERNRLEFKDTTKAFTQSTANSEEGNTPQIRFEIPMEDGGDPAFKNTTINEQHGYWIRARIVSGSFTVQAQVEVKKLLEEEDYDFPETIVYAPLIKELKVTYEDYTEKIDKKNITLCRSRVDREVRDHTVLLTGKDKIPVSVFAASEEGPALYLAFKQAFPPTKWVKLLLDVKEADETDKVQPLILWEYWNGTEWFPMQVSDGSENLRIRDYLGFFAPHDHAQSIEFGQNAFWVRARPHKKHPVADAGIDKTLLLDEKEMVAIASLSGAGSSVYNRLYTSKYEWRLVSSSPPLANAGPDQKVSAATVAFDASQSLPSQSEHMTKYLWRIVMPEVEPRDEMEAKKRTNRKEFAIPYLKAVRLNTVSALNASSMRDEVLGASNGKPNQVFTLTHTPVLLDAQIAVQEPDQPPQDELQELENDLQKADKTAKALLSPSDISSVWLRWHRVSNFRDSKASSRHFVLDPNTGDVSFGDGIRGKIPPAGRDNIRAVLYRTHQGADGNVDANSVIVVRNPSDELANIASVNNPESAAGGSSAELVEEVKLRGPWTLKHRHQAVTRGGYEWLALETSSEVARAFCTPALNRNGVQDAGWVTVTILPESIDTKPVPSAALLRRVHGYLENRALTNLTSFDNRPISHIHVKGPDYIEIIISAWVVPKHPQKADKIKLDILKRVETFLHPLRGGPERKGWELGRDVYLSEVYAEIQAVADVDHVIRVQLEGSVQQNCLYLEPEQNREGAKQHRKVPFELPVGSQVGLFDERIRMLSAEPLMRDQALAHLTVYGFKVGDTVTIVTANNTVLVDNLSIADINEITMNKDITDNSYTEVFFSDPFDRPNDWEQHDALSSSDYRLRLPLRPNDDIVDGDDKIMGVRVQGLKPQDRICVVSNGLRHPDLEFLPIIKVEICEDHVVVPAGHLVYSGRHKIEMALE